MILHSWDAATTSRYNEKGGLISAKHREHSSEKISDHLGITNGLRGKNVVSVVKNKHMNCI